MSESTEGQRAEPGDYVIREHLLWGSHPHSYVAGTGCWDAAPRQRWPDCEGSAEALPWLMPFLVQQVAKKLRDILLLQQESSGVQALVVCFFPVAKLNT